MLAEIFLEMEPWLKNNLTWLIFASAKQLYQHIKKTHYYVLGGIICMREVDLTMIYIYATVNSYKYNIKLEWLQFLSVVDLGLSCSKNKILTTSSSKPTAFTCYDAQ